MLIGREEEKKILLDALTSKQSEMIAVYGRRRVGKTFLIKSVFEKHLCFSLSGIHNASLQEQLQNFSKALHIFSKKKKVNTVPNSWFDAFDELKQHIINDTSKAKKVLFIDELPWLDTPKSNFVLALEHFWNSWADNRKNIVLVICGSAASWMINKVINSKGGLHNRVTKRVRLMPFTLKETELLLKHKYIKLQHYDICQLYMAIGGIPFYLNEIRKGESVSQNIERICFSKDGLLQNEFNNLYKALFNNSDKHIKIIKALANAPKGINRNEIIKRSKLASGGGITTILNELLESGFITETHTQDTKIKNSIFRLTDEYSLFYLKFIQSHKASGKGIWNNISKTQSYISWSGYAFENLCFKHAHCIKKALGISGVYTNIFSWQHKSSQIDMLIDRDDRCINVCEIKFYNGPFEIKKPYAQVIQNKIQAYKETTRTKKSVFITFIAAYGLKDNMYKSSLVENTITLNDLFD